VNEPEENPSEPGKSWLKSLLRFVKSLVKMKGGKTYPFSPALMQTLIAVSSFKGRQ